MKFKIQPSFKRPFADSFFFDFFIALTSLAALPRLCFSSSTICLSTSLFHRYKACMEINASPKLEVWKKRTTENKWELPANLSESF